MNTIDQDNPTYNKYVPEKYPWELVEDLTIRQWALAMRDVLDNPLSLADSIHWPERTVGVRLALQMMARYVPAVQKGESNELGNS